MRLLDITTSRNNQYARVNLDSAKEQAWNRTPTKVGKRPLLS